jgi:acetyltransferase-like isoleucine patch superfamily enzyme
VPRRPRPISHIISANLKRRGVTTGSDVQFMGAPIVTKMPGTEISIGDRTVLCSRSDATSLGVSRPVILRTLAPGARIAIGDDTGLSGTTVCAAGLIRIGNRCLIGADVIIVDTDFHLVDIPDARNRRYAPIPAHDPSNEVVIEDDVFIGARTIILKGSRIGRGAVIGAGSVVSGALEPFAVAAGNPAKRLRSVRRR